MDRSVVNDDKEVEKTEDEPITLDVHDGFVGATTQYEPEEK